MRSNTSVLTCTLCPFRSNFIRHSSFVYLSYLSINLQPLGFDESSSPDSNPCSLLSPVQKVFREIWRANTVTGVLSCCRHLPNSSVTGEVVCADNACSVSLLLSVGVLVFWLASSPGALKSLCCGSAGLSMLPVSTHCCLSTNKAIV